MTWWIIGAVAAVLFLLLLGVVLVGLAQMAARPWPEPDDLPRGRR